MRLYEDLLDDLEKSETTAGRRIVNDIDDEHGYPGDKKYHKGMLIAIQKRQTVRRIKILKEQMADFLAGSEATFVTNSIPLAQKLGRSGSRIYILPGRVKGDTEAIVGSEMRDMIGRYHFTKGFFGANGIAPHSGCTTPDDEEAVCKRAAVGQCLDRFVLADSSKFGLSSHITFADLSMVTLITAKAEEHIDYRPYQQITEVHIL